jgi:hypothetical protein
MSCQYEYCAFIHTVFNSSKRSSACLRSSRSIRLTWLNRLATRIVSLWLMCDCPVVVDSLVWLDAPVAERVLCNDDAIVRGSFNCSNSSKKQEKKTTINEYIGRKSVEQYRNLLVIHTMCVCVCVHLIIDGFQCQSTLSWIN